MAAASGEDAIEFLAPIRSEASPIEPPAEAAPAPSADQPQTSAAPEAGSAKFIQAASRSVLDLPEPFDLRLGPPSPPVAAEPVHIDLGAIN